jgi:hypothetical protein
MRLIKTRYAVTVICRICGKDELTDKPWGWIAEHAPYERGRLVVSAVGAGQFTFDVVQRMRGDAVASRPRHLESADS